MERLIFHVDVNSAFLSWEATRRVALGEDDLRLIPSAIGGDRDKRSGVILAKSIPAKKYGVSTGEPVSMALRKCPELVVVKPDFKLYQRSSRAFLAVCKKYAPVVEQFSIDECFLDMTGTSRLYPDPVKIAETIKNEIRDTLGFTVNIGIGPNKLLAKMASDFEKPDKIHTLFPCEFEEKLLPLPVRDLFLVGKATAEKLEKVNIRTIRDLAALDLPSLQTIIGGKFGEQLYRFARGMDDSPVLPEREDAKGYSNSITVEEDITDYVRGDEILLLLADSVATRMRADGVRASVVSVTVRTLDFSDKSRQKKLSAPSDITNELYVAGKTLLRELWDGATPLRLLAFAATDVTSEEDMQLTFFSDEEREKSRDVDRVVDSIRNRFGMQVIVRGGAYRSSGASLSESSFPKPKQK